jgi:hypothetical protein
MRRPRYRAMHVGKSHAPIRVARMDERGPVFVCGCVNALRKLAEKRSCQCMARCRAVLQRRGEVESSIARARLTRDMNARRIVLAGTEEAPKPAECRGMGRGG